MGSLDAVTQPLLWLNHALTAGRFFHALNESSVLGSVASNRRRYAVVSLTV